MPKNDLFKKAFDEGTIDKLQIFEEYFKEWLPVFISKSDQIWKQIQIFDLFAGEGKDINGIFGSPMRTVKVLNDNQALILSSKIKIKVILNEFDREKYKQLVKNIDLIKLQNVYDVAIYNDDFGKIFNDYYFSMSQSVNFLFLDQNGIKQITEDIFSKLINLQQTDFLFFISSSYIKRFSEVEGFMKYLRIKKENIGKKSYYQIHRIVLEYYRTLIPVGKRYFLAPFSIKKASGIYGLIFGTNHTYGLEKFLHVCWKHDKLTGEANFDIDNEKIELAKPSLFQEYNIPSKRQLFERSLEIKVLNLELITNYDVYLFTLNEGFLPKDANKILRKLIEEGKLKNDLKLVTSKIHKIIQPQILIGE